MYVSENNRPELKDINNYVVIMCATKWKFLGENLNIHEDLLNIIDKDNPNNCENCCTKMLSLWLDLNPNASWGILLDAVDKAKNMINKVPDVVEKLDTAADKLPDTVEKLDIAADKLPNTIEKLDDTVEKLDTTADKLPDTVEKLDHAADKLPDTVEKLDTAADKLPDAVEKLDSVADKLPEVFERLGSATSQLCESINKLPKVTGKMQDINVDSSASNMAANSYKNTFSNYVCICAKIALKPYGIPMPI